jgi:hypothetical protein
MNAQPAPRVVDNRALLATIPNRLVRAVAAEVSPYAEALYGVVLERKPAREPWGKDEWQAVLDELDTSILTIGDFLEAEHERRVA